MSKRVAVIGATSRIGPAILTELSSAPFEITIFIRPSSSSPPAYPHVKLHTLPSDSPSFEEWVESLAGFDVLVCAMGISSAVLQTQLADACAAAKVRRYILADYGSVSSDDSYTKELLEMYKEKAKVRAYADLVSTANPAFTWTSLITGHFFDYGLKTELLGFNLAKNEVNLFDGGKIRWSSSTLSQIGRAVVGIVKQEAETANRLLYIQSFCHSQLDILKEVERASGRTLKRIEIDSKDWIEARKQKAKDGDSDAIEELVEVLGILRSNWEDGRKGFANELLGLREENLARIVDGVIRPWQMSWLKCVVL